MAERGGGYISALGGCWGSGQDSDREKTLDRCGSSGGFIPPSRRGGPNEGYLSQAEEEIARVDLCRFVQNAQAGREGPAEHGEEQNAHAGRDTNRHEENGACTNRTREEEENARVENPGLAENSDGDGDDQINLHEIELESSDETDEEVIKLPCIFPVIFETREPIGFKMCESPDQIDEEEQQEQQYCTPPRPSNAGPLQRPASYESAPPGQIHLLCNKFDSVSLSANTSPRKHSRNFRVRPTSGRINGSGPTIASPDRLEPKHNTPEEMFHRDKIFGSVASPERPGRPIVSSCLKPLRSLGTNPPFTLDRRRRKPETDRGSPSPLVSSVRKCSPSRALLPERYRAQKTGDPFVDEVVAQEMADWAREERKEAEAKKKKKKDMANPHHP